MLCRLVDEEPKSAEVIEQVVVPGGVDWIVGLIRRPPGRAGRHQAGCVGWHRVFTSDRPMLDSASDVRGGSRTPLAASLAERGISQYELRRRALLSPQAVSSALLRRQCLDQDLGQERQGA